MRAAPRLWTGALSLRELIITHKSDAGLVGHAKLRERVADGIRALTPSAPRLKAHKT